MVLDKRTRDFFKRKLQKLTSRFTNLEGELTCDEINDTYFIRLRPSSLFQDSKFLQELTKINSEYNKIFTDGLLSFISDDEFVDFEESISLQELITKDTSECSEQDFEIEFKIVQDFDAEFINVSKQMLSVMGEEYFSKPLHLVTFLTRNLGMSELTRRKLPESNKFESSFHKDLFISSFDKDEGMKQLIVNVN